MEKLPHQEYRDDLADKLKEIRNSDPENPELAKAKAQGYLQGRKEDKFYNNRIGYKITPYKEAKKQKIEKVNKDKDEKRSKEVMDLLSRDLEQIRKNGLLGDMFKDVKVCDEKGVQYLKLNVYNTKDKFDIAQTIENNSSIIPSSFENRFSIFITNTSSEMSSEGVNFNKNYESEMNVGAGMAVHNRDNKMVADILHSYIEKNPELIELESRSDNIIKFGLALNYIEQDGGWRIRPYVSEMFGSFPAVGRSITFLDKDGKEIK